MSWHAPYVKMAAIGFAKQLKVYHLTSARLTLTTIGRPNGLRFSCRLAAFANANELRVVVDSKTQNSPDLARRKAVNCNRLFGGSRFMVKGQGCG